MLRVYIRGIEDASERWASLNRYQSDARVAPIFKPKRHAFSAHDLVFRLIRSLLYGSWSAPGRFQEHSHSENRVM